VGPTRGNDIVINHHLPQKSKCMQNDKFNRYGSFGNHDFKNKYDSVFAFFKNKSYFIQLFQKKILFYSTFSKQIIFYSTFSNFISQSQTLKFAHQMNTQTDH
jgi:hypothetical protein